MRTVAIFKNGNNRAICLFREMDFEGGELEIIRKRYSIILRPVRPTWDSFAKMEKTPAFYRRRTISLLFISKAADTVYPGGCTAKKSPGQCL
uniref:hypothetical protein n=1 Tax=Leclercia sp. EC_58 TaxID=2584090 RepID=UPI0035C9954D